MNDQAGRRDDLDSDPFYKHVMATRKGSGKPYSAERAKRDLYRKPR